MRGSHGAWHLGKPQLVVLTARQQAWVGAGSFVCLPAFGAKRGSHDSVLPKKGEVKSMPLRLGSPGTSCPAPFSDLCLSPHPVLLAKPHAFSAACLGIPSTPSPDLQPGPAAPWHEGLDNGETGDHREWVPQPTA